MTVCTTTADLFPACKSRKVEVDFEGGNVTSDGGIVLVRQADRRIGLMRAVSRGLRDPRRQKSVVHPWLALLRQRTYGICLGYEDLDDHDSLRHDLGFQTGVERTEQLAGHSSMQRLEQGADREGAWAVHEVLFDQFVASFKEPPEELILDFDATNDPVHGNQEGRFFHGYYDQYCFLPLYVFCGSQLLVAYLRPSNIDPARHSWAILKLLVTRLRKRWPQVRIIFRGDSGFCRWKMFRWCERHNVGYIVGLAKNKRLLRMAREPLDKAAEEHLRRGRKVRRFTSIQYGAHTWDKARRVLVKAECSDKGLNPRFVVTNLPGRARELYEKIYCARGDMENRIKEQQLGLFADRTSCHCWWPNQFRLLLSSLAYVLIEAIRRLGLRGTELARAQVNTIRLKLLKIGAVMSRNTRRIRIHLASGCPHQRTFLLVARRLAIE
jgi:hypothetical protein